MIQEYTRKKYWNSVTYADLFERNALVIPDKEALVDDSGTRVTWRQANDLIDKLVIKLDDLGYRKDDKLIIQLPNRVEIVLLLIACEKAGVISSTVVRTLRHAEIGYLLKTTSAKGYVGAWRFRDFDYWSMILELRSDLPDLQHVFICGAEVPEGAISLDAVLAGPAADADRIISIKRNKVHFDEVAWLGLTTGTTGMPKVIETPMALATSVAPSHMSKIGMTEHDVVGALCPVSGAARGLLRFNPFAGAKGVLMEHFSPQAAFKLIQGEKITIPMMVPAQLAAMVQDPSYDRYDLSSLRVFQVSGAPLPPHVADDVERRFNCMVINHYGGMDAGSLTSVDVRDPLEVRRFSVGKPHPGNEIRLIDDDGREAPTGEIGAITFRGPTAVGGYFNDPETTRQAWGTGYFNMGDLGKIDAEGNLYIVGRKKDVIIRGGYNIYPTEIENVLMTHPDVKAAALVGYPDPIMGEKACAFVVVADGKTFCFEDMIKFFRSKKLSANKTPERLEIIAEMPLVSDMKLDKKALKAKLMEQIQQ